jgi:hypothetical protein
MPLSTGYIRQISPVSEKIRGTHPVAPTARTNRPQMARTVAMSPQSTAAHDYDVFIMELERIRAKRHDSELRIIIGDVDGVGGTDGDDALEAFRLRQAENAITNVIGSVDYQRKVLFKSMQDECDEILNNARKEATRIRGIPPGIGLTIVRFELAVRDFITTFFTNLVECNWGNLK